MQLHNGVIGGSSLCEPEDANVKRTSFEKAECPVARSLDAIGDWWSLLIIRGRRDGYQPLQRISEKAWPRPEHPDGAAARIGRPWPS